MHAVDMCVRIMHACALRKFPLFPWRLHEKLRMTSEYYRDDIENKLCVGLTNSVSPGLKYHTSNLVPDFYMTCEWSREMKISVK